MPIFDFRESPIGHFQLYKTHYEYQTSISNSNCSKKSVKQRNSAVVFLNLTNLIHKVEAPVVDLSVVIDVSQLKHPKSHSYFTFRRSHKF